MSEIDEPSPLAIHDVHLTERAPCEERLKACEVMLMLRTADEAQVKQHQAAYNQAVEDIKRLNGRIKSLENEIEHIRHEGAHTVNAMEEYLQLTENMDFKVESKRLYVLVMANDHFYLRFDRNGQIKRAYSPEEYNNIISAEWKEINKD